MYILSLRLGNMEQQVVTHMTSSVLIDTRCHSAIQIHYAAQVHNSAGLSNIYLIDKTPGDKTYI